LSLNVEASIFMSSLICMLSGISQTLNLEKG
jgi:hypothetical protein